MTVFDLLFIIAFLVSVVTMAVAAAFAIRGQLPRALRILWFYCICAAGYFAIAVTIAFFETAAGDEHRRSMVL